MYTSALTSVLCAVNRWLKAVETKGNGGVLGEKILSSVATGRPTYDRRYSVHWTEGSQLREYMEGCVNEKIAEPLGAVVTGSSILINGDTDQGGHYDFRPGVAHARRHSCHMNLRYHAMSHGPAF